MVKDRCGRTRRSRNLTNIMDETGGRNAAFFIQFLPAGALNTGTVNLPKTVKRGSYGRDFHKTGSR